MPVSMSVPKYLHVLVTATTSGRRRAGTSSSRVSPRRAFDRVSNTRSCLINRHTQPQRHEEHAFSHLQVHHTCVHGRTCAQVASSDDGTREICATSGMGSDGTGWMDGWTDGMLVVPVLGILGVPNQGLLQFAATRMVPKHARWPPANDNHR